MTETDLINRYGRVKVTQTVTDFYQSVLRSPRLGRFFDNVPIAALTAHQSAFMTSVLGGPASYTGSQLRDAHLRLDIGKDDFEEMLRLLEASLLDHDFDLEDTASIIAGYRAFEPWLIEE